MQVACNALLWIHTHWPFQGIGRLLYFLEAQFLVLRGRIPADNVVCYLGHLRMALVIATVHHNLTQRLLICIKFVRKTALYPAKQLPAIISEQDNISMNTFWLCR